MQISFEAQKQGIYTELDMELDMQRFYIASVIDILQSPGSDMSQLGILASRGGQPGR
jgi:hypothetical protein